MPSESEFHAALDKTAEYARDTGSKINTERVTEMITFEDEYGEIHTCTGHRCEEDEFIYLIAGSPELRFMSIIFFLDIRRFIASGLDEETITILLGDDDEPSDKENKEWLAAETLLNNMEQEEKEATETYLHLMLAGGEHSTSIQEIDKERDGSGLSAIVITDKIFPYESDFGISDFHEAKQSVLSAGKQASKLIERTLFIDTDSETTEQIKLQTHFGW